MELRHLRIFHEIARCSSFSKAAKKLYLSQPTVSAHMKTLETSLGLKLFTKKNELTEAGEILFQYSTKILAAVEEAKNAMENYKNGLAGSFSLVTSHTICHWVLPELLLQFKRKYPSINIVLYSEFSPKSIELILNRKVHFGIIRTEDENFSHPKLISQTIAADHSSVIISADHPLAKLEHVTVDQLLKVPLILYGKHTSYWKQIQNAYAAVGASPQIGMELNDINAVKLMVRRGMGIALLPDISVEEELRQGLLKRLHVKKFPTIKRYSTLIYHKDLIPVGHIGHFIEFINSIAFLDYKKKLIGPTRTNN